MLQTIWTHVVVYGVWPLAYVLVSYPLIVAPAMLGVATYAIFKRVQS
jgi:hypothetical protein